MTKLMYFNDSTVNEPYQLAQQSPYISRKIYREPRIISLIYPRITFDH